MAAELRALLADQDAIELVRGFLQGVPGGISGGPLGFLPPIKRQQQPLPQQQQGSKEADKGVFPLRFHLWRTKQILTLHDRAFFSLRLAPDSRPRYGWYQEDYDAAGASDLVGSEFWYTTPSARTHSLTQRALSPHTHTKMIDLSLR